MTDYNDGNWHGWNGGGCPVHPKSTVSVIFPDESFEYIAGLTDWSGPCLFRVVKAYREPREFWVTYDTRGKIGIHDEPVAEDGAHEIIHVREVRDDA